MPDDYYVSQYSGEEIDARLAAMTNLYGRNLLDNPWFTVNQRGVTSGTITDGTYTVDRWIAGNIFYNTANNALTLQAAGTWSMFYQKLDNFERYKGLTVTLSCDAAIASGSNAALVIDDGDWHAVPLQNGITKIVYTVLQSATRLQAMIFANYSEDASDTTTIVVKSVKLELGSVSTLENDTVPNYAEELVKCQRYYQIFRTQSLRPTYAADFRPVMRVNPALSTITIDSTTYYDASADL